MNTKPERTDRKAGRRGIVEVDRHMVKNHRYLRDHGLKHSPDVARVLLPRKRVDRYTTVPDFIMAVTGILGLARFAAVLLCVGLLFTSSGCRYIDYQSPEGGKLTYVAAGNDTTIGEASYERNGDGTKVGLKGYDSKAKLADTINKLAETLK